MKYLAVNDTLIPISDGNIVSPVPKNIYSVKFDSKHSIQLTRIDDFTIPKNLSGDIEHRCHFLIQAHEHHKKLAILLQGVRGTGKSLLAKMITTYSPYPTLNITSVLRGSDIIALGDYLSKCKQPLIVILEEFEKIFSDKDVQNLFLAILDGTVEHQAFFILTTNGDISIYFYNRPGRVRYVYKYTHLDKAEVQEIIQQRLNPDKYHLAEEIYEYLSVYKLTYDIVYGVIEDINRGLSLEYLSNTINIQTQRTFYDCTIIHLASGKTHTQIVSGLIP